MSEADASPRKTIGKRLQEARKLAGLSQAQAAVILGVHRPSISEIESGNRRVSADELQILCETYEVDLNWIMGSGPETLAAGDERLQLAARELSKLKPTEIDRLLRLFAAMKSDPEHGSDS